MLALTVTAAASGYLGSVREAERLLSGAVVSARDAARAAHVLDQGTDCSQPEITADLGAKPPDVGDARDRLSALDQALSRPLTPAPGAEASVRSLAASPPYAAQQPESPGDLLIGWLQGMLARILGLGCGNPLGIVWTVIELALIAALIVGAALLAWRLLARRGRGGGEAGVGLEEVRRRTAQERFAAADRLAAAGDLGAALRELAGAVATVLGGSMAWDASPLTVRELFAESGRPAELRPLLLGFEESVYGHRPVTRERYEAASAAAAPYRAGLSRRAA